MNFYKSLFAIILFVLQFAQTNAQQTVFNVPTADVLEKGKVYAEFDVSFKPNNQNGLRRFSSLVPRIVVGIGRNVEVGLNVTGNINPGADATTIVPNFKYKFYQNEKKNLAIYAGTNFYIPVRNRSYKFGTYSYLAIAKNVGKTRFTAGSYIYSKNVAAAKAVRAGGQFAVEQTINSKFGISADWITGKHANGYFTPGLIYKPTPKITGYFAYSIGNTQLKQGNHYFLFELGYNFN